MADTIRSAKLFVANKMLGIATQKGMETSSNTTVVPTDRGNMLQPGVPTGTFTADYVVPSGDTDATKLLEYLQVGRVIRLVFAVVGTKALQDDCVVSQQSLSSATADGSLTGSVTFTMVHGTPQLTAF
jgi:hypothetical protein